MCAVAGLAALGLVSLGLASVAMAGCGAGVKPASAVQAATPLQRAGLSGYVHGGQQPVVGAQVFLYAVGTTDGGAATSLLKAPGFVLTDGGGGFNITGDYTCPAGAYVYLLALGGNPGLPAIVNPELALAAGLGPCSSLSASSYFMVNEVTTAAFAYSLSAYATSDTQIGTASDLSAPFANITNLVNPATGVALASNNNLITQQAKLNTLANILAACVNSNGIGMPCSTLMSAANASPANTFQAALKIAQNPSANVGAIYNVASADAVFAPSLPSAPPDWTITATNLDSGSIVADANTYLFTTSQGNIDIELRPDVAPQNVANFLSYVNSSAYNGSFFHRSVPNFIVQGGGFYFSGGQIDGIAAGPTVVDEVNLLNLRGTLAMAKTASPNSATDQFFFNVDDNLSLQTQAGGYTVLGTIVGVLGSNAYGLPPVPGPYGVSASAGLGVVDAINADPVYSFASPFDSLPLVNYTSGSSVQASNVITVTSIVPATDLATTTAVPTITPASGTYASLPTITLRDTTPGAVIYYATDTSTPPIFIQYTGPFQLSSSGYSNVGLYAYATAAGYPNQSLYNSQSYTVGTVPAATPTPTISPNGGAFSGSQVVTLADATQGATIVYTLDGTSPSGTHAITYTGPFTISASTRVIASATSLGVVQSSTVQAIFTQQ